MIIAIANNKGGVAKTTTAVHFAYQLTAHGETALVDSDPNRSAMAWASRSETSFPFSVITEVQLPRFAQKFRHFVIDTKARTEPEDLRDLVESCDLIVLPTPTSPDDMRVTADTALQLAAIGSQQHRVLLTKVPTNRGSDEQDAREFFAEQAIPVFAGRIRHFAAYQKAFLPGIPVFEVKRDRNAKIAWSDYRAVIEEATRGQI